MKILRQPIRQKLRTNPLKKIQELLEPIYASRTIKNLEGTMAILALTNSNFFNSISYLNIKITPTGINIFL